MNLKITNGFNVLNENTCHFTNQKKDTCEYSSTVKEETQVFFDGEPSNVKKIIEFVNSEKNGPVDGNQEILEKLKSNGNMSLNQFERVKDISDFVDNSNFVIDYNTQQVNFLSDGIPKDLDRSLTPKMEKSESEEENEDPYLEMEKKFKIIQSHYNNPTEKLLFAENQKNKNISGNQHHEGKFQSFSGILNGYKKLEVQEPAEKNNIFMTEHDQILKKYAKAPVFNSSRFEGNLTKGNTGSESPVKSEKIEARNWRSLVDQTRLPASKFPKKKILNAAPDIKASRKCNQSQENLDTYLRSPFSPTTKKLNSSDHPPNRPSNSQSSTNPQNRTHFLQKSFLKPQSRPYRSQENLTFPPRV